MNRWQVFNILKNNAHEKPIDLYEPREIEELVNKTSVTEIREGLIEYLLFQMHEERMRKDNIMSK